jgi:AcrR family transcriptional regulator
VSNRISLDDVAAPVGLDRAQVVDAAVAVLEERGRLDQVALREVAERLHVRTQSLYAHVEGIAGLHRQLALRGLSALADDLTHAAIGKAGSDAIEAIVRAYVQFAARHPGLYEASLRPPGDDGELRNAIQAVTRPLNLVFASYGLDESAAVHWYRIVFASVHGFVTLRRDGLITLPGDLDESLRHMIQAFVHQIEAEAAR